MPLSTNALISPGPSMSPLNFCGSPGMEPISPTATSSSSGVKRKRTTEPKFYAVRVGHAPGVYHTYADCLEQVKGFKNATFKSFTTLTEAEQFVAGQDPTSSNGSSSGQFKFYAVRNGRVPGIYTDWPSAQKQIKGWTKPKHQKFSTRAEAQRFMEAGGPLAAAPSLSTSMLETESARLPPQNQHAQPRSFMEADVVEPYSLSLQNPSPMIAPQMHQQLLQYAQMHEQQMQQQQQQLQHQQLHPQPPPHIHEVPQPGNKKSRKSNGTASRAFKDDAPAYSEQDFEAGLGPLPPGAEDGFDPNVLLHSLTAGNVVYKTQAQREATKLQPIPPGPEAMLRVYTDGSSLRNGQKGAFAGVGVYFGPEDRRQASLSPSPSLTGAPPPSPNPLLLDRNLSEALPGPRQTNQRAELTAMLRALETVPRDRDVTIVTDSQYSINCVTKWYVQWRQRNWKNSAGKAVENRDLVENLLDRIETRASLKSQTEFEWVKGHAHDPGNEAADQLATGGARRAAALSSR